MENLTIRELIDLIIKKWPKLSLEVKDPERFLLSQTPAYLLGLAKELDTSSSTSA